MLLFIGLLLFAQIYGQSCEAGKDCQQPKHCQYAIVGGGPGGTFTAYQLAKMMEDKVNENVCLIEKNKEVGGRWNDVTLADGTVVPMGGLRWNEFGTTAMSLYTQLADDLKIDRYTDWDVDGPANESYYWNYVAARTQSILGSNDKDGILRKEYNLDEDHTIDKIYEKLVEQYNEDISSVANQGSLAEWVKSKFNENVLQYMADTDRYRSDFQDENDAASWMENYLWDSQFDGPRTYPVGGMSQFCKKMKDYFVKKGGLFYSNTEIIQIDYSEGKYTLTSSNQVFTADYLALAVPANYYKGMSGTVMDKLKSTPEYQAFLPDEVVIVGQVWDSNWWYDASRRLDPRRAPMGGQILTTVGNTSYAHLFSPSTQFEWNKGITRSVYCDDKKKMKFWIGLNNSGTEYLSSAAAQSLADIYNVTVDPNQVKETLFERYENGWSWLKKGSTANKLDNTAIFNWASNVNTNFANCSLFLPTDSFAVKFSGWGIAAWEIATKWFKDCKNYDKIDNSYYCNPPTVNGGQDYCGYCWKNGRTNIPPKERNKCVFIDITRVVPRIPFRHRR